MLGTINPRRPPPVTWLDRLARWTLIASYVIGGLGLVALIIMMRYTLERLP